jgi:hypothetical protein
MSLKSERVTATDRARLTRSTYGIELAARAAALTCGRLQWTIFFNRELAPGTMAERLFARPWIAALMARWFIEGKAAVVQHLVLTRPEGRAARIDIVRTDGELMYTGTEQAEGTGLAFSIADVERHGTAPLNLTGRVGARGIELVTIVASGRRISARSAEPLVAR